MPEHHYAGWRMLDDSELPKKGDRFTHEGVNPDQVSARNMQSGAGTGFVLQEDSYACAIVWHNTYPSYRLYRSEAPGCRPADYYYPGAKDFPGWMACNPDDLQPARFVKVAIRPMDAGVGIRETPEESEADGQEFGNVHLTIRRQYPNTCRTGRVAFYTRCEDGISQPSCVSKRGRFPLHPIYSRPSPLP